MNKRSVANRDRAETVSAAVRGSLEQDMAKYVQTTAMQ